MHILVFGIAVALIGHGIAGSLGAGVGLLVGVAVAVALDQWADGP